MLVAALFPGRVFSDTLPQPLRSGIFLDCGGNYSVKVLFDHPFASGSTQVVGNSGFEAPSIGSTLYVQHESDVLGAWSVTNIDVVSAQYMAPDSGNQSIDLNMNTAGSIQQTLPTKAGQSVVLRLSYTYNNQCVLFNVSPIPAQYQAQVVWNGLVVDTIQVAAGAPRVWQTYMKSLTAQGNDVIEIRSLTPGTCGNMLDDITVTTGATSSQVLGNSSITLQLPDGTVLPPITVPSSAVTFDAVGTTATIPLGRIPLNSAYKGMLSVQVSDGSGTWTTESVAADDSVGPWMDSARIAPNLQEGSTDSIYFWTSEPVSVGASWSFLVDRLGSQGAPSIQVSSVVSRIDRTTDEYLALVPMGELRAGDSLRLNPVAITDASGNLASDCDQDVLLGTRVGSGISVPPTPPAPLPPPPRIQIQTHPLLLDSANTSSSSGPLQVWVRKVGDLAWIGADGSAVADSDRFVGATITSNVPLGGTVYIVDNEGVFAVSGDLYQVGRAARQGELPLDSTGSYQFRVAWDGRIGSCTWASSGIYVVRLVLVYEEGIPKKTKVINKVFRVGIKRSLD